MRLGKGGIVLGIIGMLLGAGGLGFGFYTWMVQTNIQGRNVWSVYNGDVFTPTPAGEYKVTPNLALIFDLATPMSLQLVFTSSARVNGDPASYSDLFFYFMINNVRQLTPWTRVGSFESGSTTEYYSVCLQQFAVFPAGHYNITISVLSERAGNFIRESTLTIQSFAA